MTSTSSASAKSGRSLLFLGLACTILGIGAYVLQVELHHLSTPWYLPLTALLGVGLVAFSLRKKRNFWRWSALLLVVCLTGFECTFLLATRLQPYAGPLKIGQPYPAFQTQRADGAPFTQADLHGDQDTVLVFFRGRW
ncbi:MAG TPA: hypothetical protein VGP68_18400 [Gemmataceae bacterium]|jgi:hypothetical protein|nr:hypothetical protein [Gemmataceae bacterium]